MLKLELWGGHECTLNRVGDVYRDQSVLSSHHDRDDDLDRFCDLGIQALRYPVLWEKHVAVGSEIDWRFSDARLGRLAERGVRPIVGLVHHGSGPPHASLLSDRFAPGLGEFAGQVAQRYPWIEEWTPVNEPLTTARFTALYGLWHPHVREEKLFWTAVLNQIDGVRAAMRSIRVVNREAKLLQTEDFGRTYSTQGASHQAAFDNVRRWFTWDLLFGRVTTDHPLWMRLARMGFSERLKVIAGDPCHPAVVGINHYLTSDRFLDERVERYPAEVRGGNRFMAYADVEAVRVIQPSPPGFQAIMREAFERYTTPIALTEVHNGCTREEQLRWFDEAWSAASALRERGVDVRAVTAWSLLGSYDWDSLLTRSRGLYEPGAFDVRSPQPRPTALATLVASRGRGTPEPAGWRGEGWWRRDIRLVYAPVRPCQEISAPDRRPRDEEGPLLIVGATGSLGRMLSRECGWRGIRHILTARQEFDLTDPAGMARALDKHRPWALINAAGYVRVDDAEADANTCHLTNCTGAANLARACARRQIPVVAFSTDLVFDGMKGSAYVESDTPNPLNAYGQSKVGAEQATLAAGGPTLIVRTAAFFSPHDTHNFAAAVVRELALGRAVSAEDGIISPTYLPDLACAVLDLLLDGEIGIWHLVNQGAVSWGEFGREIAQVCGLPENLIRQRSSAEPARPARRPTYSALTSERGLVMPSLKDAVDRFGAVVRPRLDAPDRGTTEEHVLARGAL